MNTVTAIMISSTMVLAAVIVITRTISRANSDANEAKRQGDMMDFIREQERNRDLAEREARAASFYTLKIAMDTADNPTFAKEVSEQITEQRLKEAVEKGMSVRQAEVYAGVSHGRAQRYMKEHRKDVA